MSGPLQQIETNPSYSLLTHYIHLLREKRAVQYNDCPKGFHLNAVPDKLCSSRSFHHWLLSVHSLTPSFMTALQQQLATETSRLQSCLPLHHCLRRRQFDLADHQHPYYSSVRQNSVF